MEDTMSSYSFSHQFYQRWTCAPEPVRAAITQELKDITTLLQTQTPFESFVFSTHDLDAHIDELYQNHEAEQAIVKAIADKQAQKRAAAEQQRLEEERLEKERHLEEQQRIAQQKAQDLAETERAEEAQRQEKDLQEKRDIERTPAAAKQSIEDASNTKVNHTAANSGTATENSEDNISSTESHHLTNDKNVPTDTHKGSTIGDAAVSATKKAETDKKVTPDSAPTDITLTADHESLIHELGVHIDDYLSEQMMQLSEDLKSWLRAEVSRQLANGTENPPQKD
ncbi:hypothetical protein J3492_05790 [Psychrobacter sp. F1192]|uniref:Uncharacterized protein n=2 Tax=Psychrobacter coccoides TaxID=2818440 RepID=A0ABS3NMY7_9GAMM|nr:hypothetical protein [Psychrobacter coccoides]